MIILTDIALCILPVAMMWEVQTSIRRKIIVMALFGTRLIVPIITIPELVYARYMFNNSGDIIVRVSGDGGATWRHHPLNVRDLGYAPTVVKHKGKFLLMASESSVYTADSPLARASDYAIDILAGPERSVAATKTFVNSAVAGLALMAHATDDQALLKALAGLPGHFEKAIACDWMALAGVLENPQSLFILGRGPSFAIASEAALKFKETCAMHAEAYSAAEVMHGPLALVGPGFPVLALAARDASEPSVAEAADGLTAKGAAAFITSDKAKAAKLLPHVATGHPLTDPLPLIVSFYGFVEAFARHRGLDPDTPRNLRKVTETV